MKKIIIVSALILTSAVTAFSLTTNTAKHAESDKLNKESARFSVKDTAAPKSDIATAD
jgi:hypothetical protein